MSDTQYIIVIRNINSCVENDSVCVWFAAMSSCDNRNDMFEGVACSPLADMDFISTNFRVL